MADGTIEAIVIKDRTSPYRGGGRSGWYKLKDRSWYERKAWRFDRRGSMIRPDREAVRRNAYYRMFGFALMVVAGVLLALASVRDRVRDRGRPPAI